MATSYGQSYWEELAARNAGDASLLVEQFRSFYGELTRLKSEAQAETVASEEEIIDRVSRIQQRILELFQTHEQEVQSVGGERLRDRYLKVRYVMTALADEVFLEFDWYGRRYWYNHLLELKLYDSQNAGERFFALVEALLDEEGAQKVDLAKIYLFALVVGFEGKFRDAEEAEVLERYKRRLYRFIERAKPSELDEGVELLKEPYRHTLDRGEGELLPNLRWWATSLGLTAVVYLLLSSLIWWYYTTDMMSLAQDILSV